MIRLKRVYEEPAPDDGLRILVDRLWPRGLSKEKARIDEWPREIAPSTELRKRFAHDHSRWQEFVRLYRGELQQNRSRLKALATEIEGHDVTLLFASRDIEHNNAIVLRAVLEETMGN